MATGVGGLWGWGEGDLAGGFLLLDVVSVGESFGSFGRSFSVGSWFYEVISETTFLFFVNRERLEFVVKKSTCLLSSCKIIYSITRNILVERRCSCQRRYNFFGISGVLFSQ